MGNFSCFLNGGRIAAKADSADVILFNFEELKTYMDAFGKRKFIGKGAFGSVYRGIISGRPERNANGKQIAVKFSYNKAERVRTQWQAEIEYLPRLVHQNIIELIGYGETPERFYLVYPFMQNGTVLSKLQGLNWRRTLKIIKGTAFAVQKLHGHDPPLIHGDLRLNNVLLDKDLTPKLADFGMVRTEGEQLQSGTRSDDIYNLGILILQVIMKEENASLPGVSVAWHISDWATRIYPGKEHAVHPMLTSTGCSKRVAIAITNLGLDCVKPKSSERPTIAEILHLLVNL